MCVKFQLFILEGERNCVVVDTRITFCCGGRSSYYLMKEDCKYLFTLTNNNCSSYYQIVKPVEIVLQLKLEIYSFTQIISFFHILYVYHLCIQCIYFNKTFYLWANLKKLFVSPFTTISMKVWVGR